MKKPKFTTNPAAATDLIRRKVQAALKQEPPVTRDTHSLSHRAYFDRLAASGASAEEVQRAWHAYYTGLSDEEKHHVWQEYYTGSTTPQQAYATDQTVVGAIDHAQPKTVAELKHEIAGKVSQRAERVKSNSHVRSLSFAVTSGALVLALNFNQLAMAPIKAYIAPGSVTSTPVIVGGANQPVGPEARIIIPKINVDVPVVYDEQSVDEHKVQQALERGVVHYADTPVPGVPGNSVIVGHSSNNLFNPGKYKFAFVLLSRLENNDTFEIHYSSQRYIYRVYNKQIVKPNDVAVLGDAAKPFTTTLITCDPPGTAANRLIIQAEQISPEPSTVDASRASAVGTPAPHQVPGNAPTLFQNLRNWLFH